MKLTIAVAAALLALTTAMPSFAQQSLESTQSPPLYKPSPAVLGEVVSMTSHSVTVRTAKDEEMTFEFDSRTVMPMAMPHGQRVKVEFRLMDSGMHHAGRITRLEPGSLDWEALDRQLSYAQQERDRLEAQQAADDEQARVSASNESQVPPPAETSEQPTTTTTDQSAYRNDTDHDADNNRGVAGAEDSLPQTGSQQPLLLVVGAAATSLALGLGLGLRRRKI